MQYSKVEQNGDAPRPDTVARPFGQGGVAMRTYITMYSSVQWRIPLYDPWSEPLAARFLVLLS